MPPERKGGGHQLNDAAANNVVQNVNRKPHRQVTAIRPQNRSIASRSQDVSQRAASEILEARR
jgi:hypothetical protein